MSVTVTVADDHPLVLAGLGTVLAPYADRVRLLSRPLTRASAGAATPTSWPWPSPQAPTATW